MRTIPRSRTGTNYSSDDMDSTYMGWLLTIATVFLSWCAFTFIGKPYVKFRDMRHDISARLAEFDNVLAQWKELQDGQLMQVDLAPSKQKRLVEAQSTLRKLGTDMKAFADHQRGMVWILEKPWL
jgi:uncharacterized protein Usg